MAALLASLHSDQASLVLECPPNAPPLWRHVGARLEPSGIPTLAETRTPASFSLDQDTPFSTAPAAGLGWFGPACLAARQEGRNLLVVFDQVGVQSEANRIAIHLSDPQTGIELHQTIDLLAGGAFRFGSRLTNTSSETLELEWLASAMIPLAASSAAIVSWHGRHNAELNEAVEPMPVHAWTREIRRGISGHGGAPGLIVLDAGANHHNGMANALQLAWSGNSRLSVERDDEGFWIVSVGAVLEPGEVKLAPGESFAAPEAFLAVSTHGRNGAMAQHHAAMRQRLVWPGGQMRPRPVHLNSWEACYFDHDEERIVALAEAAATIGAERFVLDDGWFKGRKDDAAGLGDWTADPIKYPRGLRPLADRICALGMEFGLWVEPEMINPDSDLYRAHPEWALHSPGRQPVTARNQLVLDLSRTEVRDYLYETLDALLRDIPISYLKWDHNRDLAPPGGHAQVLGTYELLARLRTAHPAVEIEGCAGGGGRSDAGLVPYVHRFWTSDNIDAVSRVPIQRGFQAFLPPEVMGAHVGASPSHATGRSQSLGFRAAVAMMGHFGLELDPRQLDPADSAELAEWIAFYKRWRNLLHQQSIWLGDGADGLLWQAAGTPQEFLLFAIQPGPARNRRPQPLRLPFVKAAGTCTIELLRIGGGAKGHAAHRPPLYDGPYTYDGSWLAHAGLPLPPLKAESVAIFHGKAAA